MAFLGLGSNVGDREAHLRHAVARLREVGTVTGVSSVYETEPVGPIDQPPFLNLVVRLRTREGPEALLGRALEIEAERGRERAFRYAPRTLDIDLLLHGESVIRSEKLVVPHPRMAERAFVLVPLLELQPDVRDPVSGLAFADLLPDDAGVRWFMGAEQLQKGGAG